jgi:hypothetical protein
LKSVTKSGYELLIRRHARPPPPGELGQFRGRDLPHVANAAFVRPSAEAAPARSMARDGAVVPAVERRAERLLARPFHLLAPPEVPITSRLSHVLTRPAQSLLAPENHVQC